MRHANRTAHFWILGTLVSGNTTRWMASAIAALALTLSTPAHGQGISGATNGEPVIATTANSGTSDASYLDAFVATIGNANDMCSRINTAWNTYVTNNPHASVTVDARGFTGTQFCSSPPFPSNANGGRLLLGNVNLYLYAEWKIPARVHVEGMGVAPVNGTTANTVISAYSPTFPSNTPVIELGDSSLGGNSFDVQLRGLTVNCGGVLGCTGIFNASAQEGSTVEHVNIIDAPASGLHVSTNTPSAGHSGPYRNITIKYTGACGNCSAATVLLQVDGPAPAGGSKDTAYGFNGITVSGNGLMPSPTDCILIYGVPTRLTNFHTEGCINGVHIGNAAGTPTHNVVVETANILNQGGYDVVIGVPGGSLTAVGDITVADIGHANNSTNVNVLQDNISGHTLTSGHDAFLGFYALDIAMAQYAHRVNRR
jgi:hypothetical protein